MNTRRDIPKKTALRLLGCLLTASCLANAQAASDQPASDPSTSNPATSESAAAAVPVAAASPAASETKKSNNSDKGPLIVVIPLHDGPAAAQGMIDLWQAGFVRRKVQEAQEQGADFIVLDINTYGGRVDAAVEIGSALDQADAGSDRIPVIAYVSEKAISGGAYVALCCDRIYMRTSTTIGSSSGVIMTKEGPKAVGEKTTSYLRSQFRARAQMKPRHQPYADLWVAMVDKDLKVWKVRYTENGKTVEKIISDREYQTNKKNYDNMQDFSEEVLVEEGELLNVTYQTGFDWGMIDGIVDSRDELFDILAAGGAPARVHEVVTTWGDELSRFLSGPIPSGLLMTIGILALLTELKGAGGGIGAIIFAFCLSLYFWCQFVAGSASGLEIVVFLLGMALLAVEVFVIPGFGVFGISGVVMILGTLVLSAIPPGTLSPSIPTELIPGRWGQVNDAFLSVFLSLIFAVGLLMILARYMEFVPFFGRIVLFTSMDSTIAAPQQEELLEALVGRSGVAATDLRPAGKADVSGRVMDVVTEGDFVERGDPVRVLAVAPGRVVVERIYES